MLYFSVHVVFGEVITGQDLVRQLEDLPVDRNSRPLQDAIISNCGELVRQVKGIYFASHNFKMIKKICFLQSKKTKRKRNALLLHLMKTILIVVLSPRNAVNARKKRRKRNAQNPVTKKSKLISTHLPSIHNQSLFSIKYLK